MSFTTEFYVWRVNAEKSSKMMNFALKEPSQLMELKSMFALHFKADALMIQSNQSQLYKKNCNSWTYGILFHRNERNWTQLNWTEPNWTEWNGMNSMDQMMCPIFHHSFTEWIATEMSLLIVHPDLFSFFIVPL